MLRKKARLDRDAFNRFFSIGKRYHNPLMQLIFSPHDSFHGAVVVGKKVARGAVERNKLRRRVYDILRRSQEGVPMGVYIIITKPGASSVPYQELKGAVTTLLSQIAKVR